MPRLFAALFLLFGSSLPAPAQFGLPGGSSTTAVMVPETSAIAPGKPFTVAMKLTHPAEWHSYYKNSGGIEIPPAINWTLPEGFTAGPIQWPVPEIKDGPAGRSLIYSDSPVFLIEITPSPAIAAGETATLTAKATWQICKTACVNEKKTFTLTLPVAGEAAADPAHAALFSAARAKIPAPNLDWTVAAQKDGQDIALRLTPKSNAVRALTSFNFDFVSDQPFVQPGLDPATVTRDGETWVVPLKRITEDFIGEAVPQEDSFSGILVSKTDGIATVAIGSTAITDLSAAPGAAAINSPSPASGAGLSFPLILGGMFLGGLILNLMPCVFPVIGIKIMGFVQQAGHDRKKIVLHGLIFALGVLISFWVLALALFAGKITNWGNQLQDPRVSCVTLLVMLLLGMNLYGVFEIGTSATGVGGSLARKQGVAGTFFSGVLATLVATPCSGPFLGVAIGAAATLPAVPFFTAFTFMALGLSLPYLVLSAFPSLVERLPRPGPWMESFKQGMSFLLFATAGVFLWIYGAQVFDRNDGQKGLWVMLGLSGVACAAWIYGRWTQPFRKVAVRLAARVVALAFLLGGIAAAWPWPAPVPVAGEEKQKVEWHPWTQKEMESLLASGQPVYIDFTAKWCLTCQLNKSRAYPPEIVKLMKDKKVVAMKADKTNTNPEIEAKLKELGRTAIPVNVLYIPGQPEPIITPELLSPDVLKELFGKIP
ncbi:MAG: thioredoxin family protein [Akkermansiaceae bacterium]|nr:thioredoxin family protein [Akkermansiaceae bacterium]